MNQGAAQAWFIAGTIPFILAGALHALLALADTARPTHFTPRDRSLRPALEATQIRFGGRAAPSMWRAWLGFRLEDVWALPTPGGPNDFPRLVQGMAAGDPSQSRSCGARTLFAIRWKLGELLGWDDDDAGLGSRVPTLRDRMPVDLRDAPSGPDSEALPFTPLYLLDYEWAAEIANQTMHGVMHIGWVPDGTGGYRGQMAVLVKPNGLLGTAYMAAIRPFRHLIVYPAMMRQIERTWRARGGEPVPAPA